jgi:hypothetical protein
MDMVESFTLFGTEVRSAASARSERGPDVHMLECRVYQHFKEAKEAETEAEKRRNPPNEWPMTEQSQDMNR